MSKFTEYLLSVLFIFIAFTRPLQNFVARGMDMLKGDKPTDKAKMAYLGIIVLFFTVFFWMLSSSSSSLNGKRDLKEDFFFEVSKCNPKCSGAYYGKPATFQFTTIKQAGEPCGDALKCPSYGMIRGCSTARTYGGGYLPYETQCRTGVC